jgi:hypothetical protein
MKTTFFFALLMLCSIIVGCEPIQNEEPNNENNSKDTIPTQTDTIPEPEQVDPNLAKALQLDSTFTRKRAGTAYGKDLAEISGMVCSRVTPGYLWVQGDDTYKVRAMTPEGNFSTTIRLHDS